MANEASSLTTWWEAARSFVYDKAIVSFTRQWYLAVLDALPPNSRILDIGIGTGSALVHNASTLRAKNISVVGVDYDHAYVAKCAALIAEAGLHAHVRVVHASIYDYTPEDGRLFDHAYFSGSFMLLPRPADALRRVVELLVDREDGRVYFTQTFELQKNAVMEWVKPRLKRVTTIDFGGVSYEDDFAEAVEAGGGKVVRSEVIEDGHAVQGVREARLVCVRSKLYVPVETETVM